MNYGALDSDYARFYYIYRRFALKPNNTSPADIFRSFIARADKS